MSDETLDPNIIQVREKLNKDSIKLWLPPYSSDNGTQGNQALQDLSVNISQSLNLEPDKVLPILLYLQDRAVSKLKDQDNFLATGIADLRIKISGKSSPLVNIKISLTSSMAELQKLVAEKLELDPYRIKLISKGTVLNKDKLLIDQGVKAGALLMAVILIENPDEIQNDMDRQKDLQSTFNDIDLLTGSSSLSEDVQIADQSGKNLTLPKEEKKALVTAMVLHEKGRAALEKKDYARALLFLLEADNRFNLCNSSLLNSVDNYAVLNLDIAWCYLCLESVTQLPDGEARLQKSERSLHQSYGANLERLLTIKGSTGNEKALFMRLHLLQGIVAFHQGKMQYSAALLDKAESELKSFKIDDVSLGTIIELGYTEKEARFGLRGAYGNVGEAVELINKRREEKKEAKKKNMEDKKNKKLGYCADGKQYVRSDYVDTLVQMGFIRSIVIEALRESNNVMSSAVNLLETKAEELSSRSMQPGTSRGVETDSSKTRNGLSPELLEQISSLGFDARMVEHALKKNNFNLEKSVEELLNCDGILEGVNLDELPLADLLPSKQHREQDEEDGALARLTDDIRDSASKDYFDLDFDLEETFLVKYKSLMNNN
uniref:NEDD8 ultimate buster 1 n=2 Tax=Cacopsylla melanoneura TaxID=428564 RepID=A0A8D8TZF2_9HEMI